MKSKGIQKYIVYDQWLSDIIRRPAYKVVADKKSARPQLKKALQALQTKKSFLYIKVPVDSVAQVAFLEKMGFYLIDTNIVFEKPVSFDCAFSGNSDLRFAKISDRDEVVELARKNFRFSRFHLDKNFPPKIANTVKAEWADNYFSGKRGAQMVVALVGRCVRGFLLLIRDKRALTIDLIAVDSRCRQKKIASDMIAYVQKECKGIRQIKVGTQVANVPSLRLYEKLGFRVTGASYVFHYYR